MFSPFPLFPSDMFSPVDPTSGLCSRASSITAWCGPSYQASIAQYIVRAAFLHQPV